MPRLTIQYMAKELGLSRNTVAMALKKDPAVAQVTLDRVLAYAAECGYGTKGVLQNREKKVIVLKKPGQAVYWDKVISGITEEASENGCIIHVAVVSDEDVSAGKLPAGYGNDTDACLFMNVFPDDYVNRLTDGGRAAVFLDGKVRSRNLPAAGDMIKSEGLNSMRCITRQLIDQGLERIVFLGNATMDLETPRDRLTGYQQAMEEHGLAMTSAADIMRWNRPVTDGKSGIYEPSVMNAVLDSFAEMPEAFVCCNDEIARLLTGILRDRDLQVPEDVAVSGYDDDEDLSLSPFLTTVNPDAKWLGRRMMIQLLWRMNHKLVCYETIVVESRVIFRKSSAKYRK